MNAPHWERLTRHCGLMTKMQLTFGFTHRMRIVSRKLSV